MLPKFYLISILSSLIFTHSYSQCLDHQKNLLLELKNELIFNSSISTKLVQWNQMEDCCKWSGVECDGAGNVISLQLDHESISGGIRDSSSLFRLMYLQKLNLAYNEFNSTQIPRGIRNLTNLTHLKLSYAGFGGQVPVESLSLTRLISLEMCNDHTVVEPLKLEYPNLKMLLQNLSGLRQLCLDGVNITSSDERRKWSHIISSYLPNLTTLSLCYCSLSGPLADSFWQLYSLSVLRLDGNDLSTTVPDLFASFSSFTILSLAECGLNGSFPDKIFHLPTLEHLDLSGNELLSGTIPSFTQNESFKSISLRNTNFSGLIPTAISNLKALSWIDLSHSRFTGSIPSTFTNLTQLIHVDLSYNLFIGSIPSMMFEGLSNLVYLNLGDNSFSGNIPHSLFRLPSLRELRFRNNQFSGLVDEFPISNSSNIVKLDLSGNRLEGPIPDSLFKLQSLESLWLSGNMFNGTFQLNKIGNLRLLSLANNSLSGSIPTSLCSATYLKILELSINKLSGNIRPCLLKTISVLNLGRNNISGRIPDKFPLHCRLQYFDLNNNTLEGTIPKSLQNCKQLEFMNVGNNIINDTFPCMLSSSLRALVLHSNRFHGEVKCQKSWPNLQILDVSSNNFGGSLESINFSSWRAMVLGSDAQLRRNNLGYYPLWRIGMTLISKGLEVELLKIWQGFSAIDFSCNDFQGEIPNAMGDLSSLHLLNLSHSAFNGSIPKSFGQLRQLESLDLSQNQLTGAIPMELASLTFLSVLNLSYNKLVGEIPNGRQLQTFSADSFKGNPELCGLNLNISCTHTDLSPPEHENVREIEWEYVSTALGYVVGLGSIVWLLLFCRSFRQKYFDKIDEVVEEIFNGRNKRRRSARRRVVRDRVGRQ